MLSVKPNYHNIIDDDDDSDDDNNDMTMKTIIPISIDIIEQQQKLYQ